VFGKRNSARRAGLKIEGWNVDFMRLANPDVGVVALFDTVRGKAAGDPHFRSATRSNNAERYARYGGLLDGSGSDCIVLTVAIFSGASACGSEAIIIFPQHLRTLRPEDAGEIDI
jgi:hypothetical protein